MCGRYGQWSTRQRLEEYLRLAPSNGGETAHERPLFSKRLRERRCLVPADCFYEWKTAHIVKNEGPQLIEPAPYESDMP